MAPAKGQTDAVKQVEQAADGSFIVSMVGGGEIHFFVNGLGSLVGAKIEVVPAKRRGLFDDDDDDEPRMRRPTMELPAVVLDPNEKASGAAPRPAAPLPKRPGDKTPLLWIRARKAPDAEHRQARPWLVEAEGLRVGLLPGYTYCVGRDETADIRIVEAARKGDTVSRKHATLGVIGDGLQLVDEDSRNGTYVGSDRVVARSARLLRKRENLFFGKFALVVRPAPDDLKVP